MRILLRNVLGIGIIWLYKGFWGSLSCPKNCNKVVNKINKIVNKIGFKINKIATKSLTKLLTKSPPKCNKSVNKIPPQNATNLLTKSPLNQRLAQKSPKLAKNVAQMGIYLYMSKDLIALRFMTVGFLYGAGAETLIFVTGTSGKKSETFRLPAEKPKSAADTQKTKKNRCLGIRCWDPNPSGGYQNCGLGIHPWEIFQNRSGKNSEFFSKVLGGSQRQLWIKTRPSIYVFVCIYIHIFRYECQCLNTLCIYVYINAHILTCINMCLQTYA